MLYQTIPFQSPLTAGFIRKYISTQEGPEGEFALRLVCQPTLKKLWELTSTLKLVEDPSIIERYEKRSDIFTVNSPIQSLGWVQVVTLDEVIGKRKVDFIKVDVEGFEKEVLIGAWKIMRQVKLWQIEIHNPDSMLFFDKMFRGFGFQTKKHSFKDSYGDFIVARRNN